LLQSILNESPLHRQILQQSAMLFSTNVNEEGETERHQREQSAWLGRVTDNALRHSASDALSSSSAGASSSSRRLTRSTASVVAATSSSRAVARNQSNQSKRTEIRHVKPSAPRNIDKSKLSTLSAQTPTKKVSRVTSQRTEFAHMLIFLADWWQKARLVLQCWMKLLELLQPYCTWRPSRELTLLFIDQEENVEALKRTFDLVR
jgi:hypothetical protein